MGVMTWAAGLGPRGPFGRLSQTVWERLFSCQARGIQVLVAAQALGSEECGTYWDRCHSISAWSLIHVSTATDLVPASARELRAVWRYGAQAAAWISGHVGTAPGRPDLIFVQRVGCRTLEFHRAFREHRSPKVAAPLCSGCTRMRPFWRPGWPWRKAEPRSAVHDIRSGKGSQAGCRRPPSLLNSQLRQFGAQASNTVTSSPNCSCRHGCEETQAGSGASPQVPGIQTLVWKVGLSSVRLIAVLVVSWKVGLRVSAGDGVKCF